METIKAEVQTRHSADCPYKSNVYDRRCRCRKMIYLFDGKRTRLSARTRSWEQAEKIRKQLEGGENPFPDAPSEIPEPLGKVSKVVKEFLDEKAGISKNLLGKYTRELNDLVAFCDTRYDRQLVEVKDIDLLALEKFRQGWTGATISKNKRLERLRTFLHYCLSHRLIDENHATNLKKPKTKLKPTLPLEQEEWDRLMAAVNRYHARGRNAEYYRQRARAMLLLLRWSGLRISDAAKLECSKISTGPDGQHILRLYTGKTGTPINVPLPHELVTMLRHLPNVNPQYFFWNGTSDIDSPAKRWWSTISKIAKLAGVRARAHMLRDTFVVEALKSRQLTLEQVSKILGHSSVKITEKHYWPWVPALQQQLEDGVRAMWPKSIFAPAAQPVIVQ